MPSSPGWPNTYPSPFLPLLPCQQNWFTLYSLNKDHLIIIVCCFDDYIKIVPGALLHCSTFALYPILLHVLNYIINNLHTLNLTNVLFITIDVAQEESFSGCYMLAFCFHNECQLANLNDLRCLFNKQ